MKRIILMLSIGMLAYASSASCAPSLVKNAPPLMVDIVSADYISPSCVGDDCFIMSSIPTIFPPLVDCQLHFITLDKPPIHAAKHITYTSHYWRTLSIGQRKNLDFLYNYRVSLNKYQEILDIKYHPIPIVSIQKNINSSYCGSSRFSRSSL